MPEKIIANRYRLDSLIATGGRGAVWRGYDTRLDRAMAVKLLRNSSFEDDARSRTRFEREAKAVAKLKGPGIVAVHDHGEDASDGDAVAYLVMELVEGESLSALLERDGPLPAERTMEIIASVAGTLDVVHRDGIVHRDIKPANILIEPDGAVKVVDFGIARVSGASTLTSSGVSLGTLSYAAPEQVGFGEITALTDVYALGAVAYECLAGQPPFASDDPKTVVAGHLSAEPPPLHEVSGQVARVAAETAALDRQIDVEVNDPDYSGCPR